MTYKPNIYEIKLLLNKRNISLRENSYNLYYKIFFECRSSLNGGYIDLNRALKLKRFIKEDSKIYSIFPNNFLLHLLDIALSTNGWNDEIEIALLDFINELYIGDNPESRVGIGFAISLLGAKPVSLENTPERLKPPENIDLFLNNLLKGKQNIYLNLYDLIFDEMPLNSNLNEMFLGFTGAFEFFTRKTCFESAKRLNGMPAENCSYYLDYLFVGNKITSQRLINSALATAINNRRVFGKPLIYKESDFMKLINKY